MVSDKEILIQALESFASNTVSSLFGMDTIATRTLIRYAVRSMADKYDFLFDIFTDKNGNINTKLLLDAARSEIKARDGLKIGNIKFTEKDVDEINNIIKKLSENNENSRSN